MQDAMLCGNVSVVMDVVRTVLTILCSIFLHRIVVVEGDSEHHGQIHQYQQPCYSFRPIVKRVHLAFQIFLCKVMYFVHTAYASDAIINVCLGFLRLG